MTSKRKATAPDAPSLGQTNFADLPPELVLEIFKEVENLNDLRNLGAASQSLLQCFEGYAHQSTAHFEPLQAIHRALEVLTSDERKNGITHARYFQLCANAAQMQWDEIQFIRSNWPVGSFKLIQGIDSPAISIKELKARNALLDAIHAERIGQEINLQATTLDLSNMRLTRFPESVLTDVKLNNFWQALQWLSLSCNQLSGLPEGFGQLQALQLLYLSNNQLSSLPAELGQLQELKELYLHNNQLSSLPAELRNLQALQVLDLKHNQLTEEILRPLAQRYGDDWFQRTLEANEGPKRSRVCSIL